MLIGDGEATAVVHGSLETFGSDTGDALQDRARPSDDHSLQDYLVLGLAT